ncbi:hypothetical protein BT69DRAFT_1308137 [Atractiella rhizophila]|nr:hypothetical protein BT69DRAFT_1308137 [Atractiella rhizophila]
MPGVEEKPRLTPSGKPIGPRTRRIAIMGSRAVGKSSISGRFVEGLFVDNYYPTIEQTLNKTIKYKGQDYALEIYDTAGHDEYTILQNRQAVGFHGWIMCYAVDNPNSFKVAQLIKQKISDFTGRDSFPMILVGNKCDLNQARQVSPEQGQELAKKLHCPFIETSAKTSENVNRIFEFIVQEMEKELNPDQQPQESKCTIS